MHTIGFLRPIRSALSTGWDPRCVGSAANREADKAASDFSATLLAMAGHDLRQPLQLITSAHDILAQTPLRKEQREELSRAASATAQLAGMLGQLVEALQLRERSGDDLHLPVPLRPVLEALTAEFGQAARRKAITFLVTAARDTVLSHPVLLSAMLRNLIRNAIDYTPSGGSVLVTCTAAAGISASRCATPASGSDPMRCRRFSRPSSGPTKLGRKVLASGSLS